MSHERNDSVCGAPTGGRRGLDSGDVSRTAAFSERLWRASSLLHGLVGHGFSDKVYLAGLTETLTADKVEVLPIESEWGCGDPYLRSETIPCIIRTDGHSVTVAVVSENGVDTPSVRETRAAELDLIMDHRRKRFRWKHPEDRWNWPEK